MNRHISQQFDAELDAAKRALVEMAVLVEQQLADAGRAFFAHDELVAENVTRVEQEVNAMETALDDDCVQIIARRQPTATDLRTMIAIMRSSTDLERIGDESAKIAKFVRKTSHVEPPSDGYGDLRAMHMAVVELVSEALDALGRNDVDKALDVIAMDAEVDRQFRAITAERSESLKTPNANVELVLNVLWVARALERIGDHGKNICEYMIYAVSGRDVRHAGSRSGSAQ